MKKLVCEMCGSSDLIKQEGVFVCQSCGTKYSVEEARKMMVEGTVEVQGTVKVDNTDQIKNYIEMAKSAYEAENKSEAEAYCNRIIEIDPRNSEAWFMKGKAAGWQSTVAKIRFDESVQCFSKAVDYAPEDKVAEVKKSAADEMASLSIALMTLCCRHFAELPTNDNANTVISCGKKTKECSISLLKKCDVEPAEFSRSVATLINNGAMNAYNTIIYREYKKEEHPSKYDFSKFLERTGFVSTLLKYAIDFADDDDEADVVRYQNLISIERECINGGGWEREYNQYAAIICRDLEKKGIKCHNIGGGYYYYMNTPLTDEAKSIRSKNISTYEEKITQCQNAAKRKRAAELERKEKERKEKIEKYWAEHADEKAALEAELNSLNAEKKQLEPVTNQADSEIAKLREQLNNVATPTEVQKNGLRERMAELARQRSALGLFKTKEKKALNDQIAVLESQAEAMNAQIEAEKRDIAEKYNANIQAVNDRVAAQRARLGEINNRIGAINNELNKDR